MDFPSPADVQYRPPSWSHPESHSEVRMGISVNSPESEITGEHLTVRSAAKISGYNEQYLRRLLRNGLFQTRKFS